MKFSEYKAAYAALRERYKVARDNAGHEPSQTVIELDTKIEKLYVEHYRVYRHGDLSVTVNCESGRVWVGATVASGCVGIGCFTAEQLRVIAEVRETADRYERDEIDELPRSGAWIGAQGRRGPATSEEGIAINTIARRIAPISGETHYYYLVALTSITESVCREMGVPVDTYVRWLTGDDTDMFETIEAIVLGNTPSKD